MNKFQDGLSHGVFRLNGLEENRVVVPLLDEEKLRIAALRFQGGLELYRHAG